MDDVIYRKGALDAIRLTYSPWLTELIDPYRAQVKALKELPSARKKGHWIVVTRHEHYPSGKPYEQLRCPFCKRFDHNGDGSFCGYCGADMRGEEN